MKKDKIQEMFLNHLRKVPIVQLACEKSGVSRNSIYRWKKEDIEFSKKMDDSIAEGEDIINDLTESQLLTLIKEKSWSAIRFWLKHRNSKFKDKLEITTKVEDEKLTPEQEKIIREALSLGSDVNEGNGVKIWNKKI